MKLRIKGNSVRLRLTQREVAELAATGRVEDRIEFGFEPEQFLTYAVVAEKRAPEVFAKFENGQISIIIPQAAAEKWAASDDAGICAEQNLSTDRTLRIAVEKDFACLTPRAGEDESDNFPHPKSEKNC